jgi:hypothetical protein
MSGALKEREASEHPPTVDIDICQHQPPYEYRVGEICWSSIMKAVMGEHAQPKLDYLWDCQPVEITEVWSDMV